MEDDIWESLKQFCKENKDQFETIPWGSSMKGEGNLMYGLRGENHPSHAWWNSLSEQERKLFVGRITNGVKGSWMNATERRKSHSETMKEKWASGKINADQSRKNGNHGMIGKEVHNSKIIEYKGKIYYGWRELQEGTGVTKHLYNKYYLKGVDPEFRIGANGPAKGTP